ncbi:MAG TPA: glutamine synthetase family protein [Desulfobacterales bacterium]|nr:glutamine synthetase family protein [Desulfobacterales bacterium]
MATIEDINMALKETTLTKIFFTDLNGRIMNLPINPENIESIISHGIGFDGSSVAGYATVDSSDRLLFPDPESFRIVELADEKLGFFIGHIYNDKKSRAQADPRSVLERVLKKAETEYGFKFQVGPEHEFFILAGDEFGEKIYSDKAGYFQSTPHGKGELVRNRIVAVLKACGIRFEKAHHEVAPSQHEINLECTDPLTAADRTVLFNYITQKVAVEFGYHATFMPKPFDDFNRNAFHIHISMQDIDGKNRFYDADSEDNISSICKKFIAGILHYARESSIIMASTFNSYKAYILDREAPIIRSWGLRNRSSMVRVPYSQSPESTRIELRNPDPAGNPYLQIATLIAMGLQGIKENFDCGPPDIGSTYKKKYKYRLWDKRFLPKSMFEALVEADRSKFLKDFLGDRIYNAYMALKINDWEDHRVHVTPRELNKYLSI